MLPSIKETEIVNAIPTGATASLPAKRQRRQAAAACLFPISTPPVTAPSSRKSTAQPRPVLHIPPRGIGPIIEPNINDVLCGRGGRINSHSGNIQFRDMVNARKKDYLAKSTKKLEKAHIAAKIVEEIRSMDPPGRFLKEDGDTGMWWDIGDQKAIKKSGQALREDAPDIRQELDGDGDDADSNDEDTKPTKTSKDDDGAIQKDAKRAEKPAESKTIASTTTTAKTQAPKASQGGASTRPNVQTPVISNNSRGCEPSTQQSSTSRTKPENFAALPNFQKPPHAPLHDAGGVAYDDYAQRLRASQLPYGVPASPYVVIPLPLASPASASNPNNARNAPGIYSVPSNVMQGVRAFGPKVSNFSEKASEVMQDPQQQQFTSAVPTGGVGGDGLTMLSRRPPSNVAFGRTFHPPTELSSGTMSTISGLSSVLNPEGSLLSLSSYRSHGGVGGSMLTGSDLADQQRQQFPSAGGLGGSGNVRSSQNSSFRASQLMQDSRRLTHMSGLLGGGSSDITLSLRSSLGSWSRSHSFPDLSNSIREEMRRFDESFAHNHTDNMAGDMSIAPESVLSGGETSPVENLPPGNRSGDLQIADSTSTAGARPTVQRSGNRSISTNSAMSLSVASISLASAASRGSYISESSWNRFAAPDDGTRSIMSDLSNDIVALDLAAPPR